MKNNAFLMVAIFIVASTFSVFAQLPSPPSGQEWVNVFDENFDTWNSNEWGRGETPWGTENQSSCNLIPPGNTDAWVSDGILRLRARSGNFTGPSGDTYPYTSGWAWTKNWKRYGYIEIRAQFPDHRGAWPAFWMLGDGWPPEFDIAEYRGAPRSYMTRAFYNGTWYSNTMGGDYTGWNTYGLEWLPDRLRWYVNGNLRYEWTGTTPNEDMYIILSNGTDCNDGDGSGLPSYFNVDWVRWWQLSETGGGSGGGEGTYQLRNRGTGLYLDGMGRTGNGDACGQYANTTSPNAQWEMIDAGSSQGTFYYFQNVGTGMKLDGYGRTTNGDDVAQYANTTTHVNAQWIVEQYDGNYYRIQNRSTGLYLDGMGRTGNGDACGQYANTTSPNAQWELISLNSAQAEQNSMAEKGNAINVYPTPAIDNIDVSLAGFEGGRIAIYNSVGQLVVSRENVEAGIQTFDVSNFSNGVYIVKVSNSSGSDVVTKKFTKE